MLYSRLEKIVEKNKSFLCVGLDSDFNQIPEFMKKEKDPLFSFNKKIIDATIDLVCCYKPQIAYYSAQKAEDQLEKTIGYIKQKNPDVLVILDSKRGDIESTALQYAKESFDRYGADAVTLNPYMGFDVIDPFLRYSDKGLFILCKTSNPSSRDFQNLLVDGIPLYKVVAKKVIREWNTGSHLGLVVGATNPDDISEIRKLSESMPLLVPGVGAQGGNLGKVLEAGLNQGGRGLIINSSRAIIYADKNKDFELKSRKVCLDYLSIMKKYFPV